MNKGPLSHPSSPHAPPFLVFPPPSPTSLSLSLSCCFLSLSLSEPVSIPLALEGTRGGPTTTKVCACIVSVLLSKWDQRVSLVRSTHQKNRQVRDISSSNWGDGRIGGGSSPSSIPTRSGLRLDQLLGESGHLACVAGLVVQLRAFHQRFVEPSVFIAAGARTTIPISGDGASGTERLGEFPIHLLRVWRGRPDFLPSTCGLFTSLPLLPSFLHCLQEDGVLVQETVSSGVWFGGQVRD